MSNYFDDDFFSPNGDIEKLKSILLDYFSSEKHPTHLFVAYETNPTFFLPEPGIDIPGLGRRIAMTSNSPTQRITIEASEEGKKRHRAIVSFNAFPGGVRIRFSTPFSAPDTQINEIINEVIKCYKAFGYRVVPFDWKNNEELMEPGTKAKIRGMSPWRERRANIFKEVKDENIDYSANEVAVKATTLTKEKISKDLLDSGNYDKPKLEPLVEETFRKEYSHGKNVFSADDVRNDYKTMDWNWEDSRNIN